MGAVDYESGRLSGVTINGGTYIPAATISAASKTYAVGVTLGTQGTVYVDRTHSGGTGFHPQFAARHTAPVTLRDGGLPLRILVDRGSVTVFAADGEAVLTDQVFPPAGADGINLFGVGGDAEVRDLNIWSLNSIWKDVR